MMFGAVPLEEAEGTILAHSAKVEGGRIAKGTVLHRQDVERLAAAGLREVVVARAGAGDVLENPAALRIASAVAGPGLKIRPAATGRVNLHAEGPGILGVERAVVDAMNAVNPMLTLACLPEWTRVGAGAMVATVKVISYAVPEVDVAEVERIATRSLSLRTIARPRAVMIETQVRGAGQAPSPKGFEAMAERVGRLGGQLDRPRQLVEHEVPALADALGEARADVILILTASATSDPADVAPEAVRRAGGRVIHYGMPVDPGNLLFLGEIGATPVIGLPGCARSLAMNGADWVLERVLCGVPVSPANIAAMGVGGLLKDIPERGRRREPQEG